MIHDVLIEQLDRSADDGGWSLTPLRYSDPLLHRIGMIQIVRLSRGERTPFRLRARADEVWALGEGEATFHWLDHRTDSPTSGERQEHQADSPTRVLAPFGVAFGVKTDKEYALLVRMATEENDTDVQILDWPTR